MGKPMTKDQALQKLEKEIGKVADAGEDRIKKNLPKMKASMKKLADALKANESPDLIDTLARHLKLQMRGVAEGTTLYDEVVRRLKAYEQDEPFFELVADEMAEGMAYAAKILEPARKELAAAKKLLDQALEAGKAHAKDSKQAREEWAEAKTEVDRLIAGAAKEIAAWEAWGQEADDAAGRRDAKTLARLQKAKPASASLDDIAGRPAGTAFKSFDKEFDWKSLDADLQAELQRDREAAIVPWFKAQQAAKRKGEIQARVAALAVQPRDAAKALKELGLPAAARAKVQAALDGPAAALGKSVETIAKGCKVTLTAADALAKLKKAGVI